MSREIKFRAWSLPEGNIPGEMLNWDDIWTGDAFNIICDADPSCILMQFTGLLDKNGVEIYEGDILANYEMHSYPVEFVDGGFWCVYPNGEKHMPAAIYREVVGNIYQAADPEPEHTAETAAGHSQTDSGT